MGDGITDQKPREELPDAEMEEFVRKAIKKTGVITWWPGGRYHNTICRMLKKEELIAIDCSTSQETVYEVKFK